MIEEILNLILNSINTLTVLITYFFIIFGASLIFIVFIPIRLLAPTLNVDSFFTENNYFWIGLLSITFIFLKKILSFDRILSSTHQNERIEVIDYDLKSQFPKVVINKTEIKKLKDLTIYAPNPYPQPTKKFFCQIDSDYHPPKTKVYICSKCERYVCASCYQVAKEAGMFKCPYCYSQLHKCETEKEKIKESDILLTKTKNGKSKKTIFTEAKKTLFEQELTGKLS